MFTRLALIPALLALSCLRGTAQSPDTAMKGIHQTESEYYSAIYGNSIPPGNHSAEKPASLKSRKNSDAAFMVYGWHPYWAGTNDYLNYNYDVLTHISYFSYEVDTASGYYTTIRGWDTTPVIGYAHQRGVKVMLTVTNFGSERNTKILTDTVKQWHLISTLVSLLKSRNGDGVNFDFEIVPASMKSNMVSFCKRAVKGIKSELPQAEISFATPSVNWSDGWDLAGLAAHCDYLIMMGYNYYYGGSSTAGPVAPLTGENYNISKSIDQDYLGDGVAVSKLLLGMPWYGYDWPVSSTDRKAPTTGTGSSRIYSATLPMVVNHGKTFDTSTGVPWMNYQDMTGRRQMWFEDSLSLVMKTSYAFTHDLAGIGIWALSYEKGRPELWNGIMAVLAGTVSSDDTPSEPGSIGTTITRITPNPAVEEAVVQYYISKPGKMTLAVYDAGGRLMAIVAEGMALPGTGTETIHTGTLPPGVYFCVLTATGGRDVVKFAVAGVK